MLKGSESFNRIAESLSDITQSPAVKAATDTAEQIRASFADTGVDLNQIGNTSFIIQPLNLHPSICV